MADHEDGHALGGQRAHPLVEFQLVRDVEVQGRLVQQEHPPLLGQGPGDDHPLPLAEVHKLRTRRGSAGRRTARPVMSTTSRPASAAPAAATRPCGLDAPPARAYP